MPSKTSSRRTFVFKLATDLLRSSSEDCGKWDVVVDLRAHVTSGNYKATDVPASNDLCLHKAGMTDPILPMAYA